MVKGHGTYGIIVCLEDSFEIEGEAIPEGEFTGSRTCEDASGFGGPDDDVDGRADFVGGCVDEFGAEGSGGVFGVGFGEEDLGNVLGLCVDEEWGRTYVDDGWWTRSQLRDIRRVRPEFPQLTKEFVHQYRHPVPYQIPKAKRREEKRKKKYIRASTSPILHYNPPSASVSSF